MKGISTARNEDRWFELLEPRVISALFLGVIVGSQLTGWLITILYF
jgi:hypothetical protein